MNNQNKIRLCFRLHDAGIDENGMRCPAGMCINLGETNKAFDYAELVKGLDVHALMATLGLTSIDTDKLEIITPEEYDQNYGDGGEPNDEDK